MPAIALPGPQTELANAAAFFDFADAQMFAQPSTILAAAIQSRQDLRHRGQAESDSRALAS
jgi:hypothetical protein